VTRPLCSVAAEAAGDAREGTAPPADRWFLVEHPGPWGRIAFAQSGLPASVVGALDAWGRAQRGRVLLVRRPGRRPRGPGPRRWFRVDSRPGHESVRTGWFSAEHDIAAALDDPGVPWTGPLRLVCAHGRHDTCCAMRGRPIAAALAGADPDATWECSHLGGCRFAPALVLLPHGLVFGGVPVGDAVAVAKEHAAGRVDPRYLRGRSALPPAAQAAQHHARLATGATGVDDLRVTAIESPAPDRWRVAFTAPDVVVELAERTVDAGRPLTCAAVAPGRLRTFDLLTLTRGTGA
jgi:hypothetical protein